MENTYRIPGNTKHNISFIFRLRYEEENLLRLPAKKKKKVSLFVKTLFFYLLVPARYWPNELYWLII